MLQGQSNRKDDGDRRDLRTPLPEPVRTAQASEPRTAGAREPDFSIYFSEDVRNGDQHSAARAGRETGPARVRWYPAVDLFLTGDTQPPTVPATPPPAPAMGTGPR